ncbi:glycosyltransferase [Streptomyces sp. NPDC057963]|uniref:glycosyltransferase n=1 Tax=Streptomyces sp. NPDC057963 TaxID=3346290 RepID=UPI0036E26E74
MKLWHVNTTARGGGVAEILDALCGYTQPVSPLAHCRFVTSQSAEVFAATKRIHHRLHGVDRGDLPDEREHAVFLAFAEENASRLLQRLTARDVVLLHDPQTLPLAPILAEAGVPVAWRCHIGTSAINAVADETWQYLSQFWPRGITLIFSHQSLVPAQAAGHRVEIVPPSIDPTAAKNRPMSTAEISDVLASAGLIGPRSAPEQHRHELISEGRLDSDPVILQVSRWDPLKDMEGVLRAFADSALHRSAQLVLCGPSPQSVADDPEAKSVLEGVIGRWRSLPTAIRRRAHLMCTALDDSEGNARIVNALQRWATVVTQRSVQEGFGLTVTEAMLKARPVVATRVGGIPSQITHNETGLLLNGSAGDGQFSKAVACLLTDKVRASTLGRAAAAHATQHFTTTREASDHWRIFAPSVHGNEERID